MKPKIYLAGWTGETEYRKYCMENYSNKFELIDPLIIAPEDNRGDFVRIVTGDKELIKRSNALLAYITRPTFGTVMEIIYAYDVVHIPVVIVNPDRKFFNDPWLRYHSGQIVPSIEDAFRGFEKYFQI